MKTRLLLSFLFGLLCIFPAVAQSAQLASGNTFAANTNGANLVPTAASCIKVSLSPGANACFVDLSGTYVASFNAYVSYQSGATRLVATSLSANAQGVWNFTVTGPGTLYLVEDSYVSGTPSAALGCGPAGSSSSRAFLAVAPASWATGTDWVPGSSPVLPTTIRAIWINILPGTVCSIKVDAGGATGFVFGNVQAGWFWVPSGLGFTKFYAPANGSTGAVISGVLY